MTSCSWLENMMSIETDGWTRPCCLETDNAARISKISDGIRMAFNHPKLMQLREDLKDGFSEKTHYACNRCASLESHGQDSMRTTTRKFEGNVRELKVLQFKMSNKCQLACAHCGPDRSSTWRKLLDIQPRVLDSFEVTDAFLEELVEILPNLEVLKFSGGEPFLDPNHWKILEHLKNFNRKHCEIQYITNGLIKPRTELWQGWREIKCSVSVDGFEESYEWFRRGASWSDLLNTVSILEQSSTVSVNYSLTPYTVADYHRAKSFWKFNFGSFPIVYPEHCSMFKFPLSYIKQLDDWQNIPSVSSCIDSDKHLNIYRNWAKNSDKLWNTVGMAEKLFWWMKV